MKKQKMLILNGERFEIFVIDSFDTLVERIANHFETLPKYLSFEPNATRLDDFNDANLSVINWLSKIANQEQMTVSPEILEFAAANSSKINFERDVVEIFIAFNTTLKHADANNSVEVFIRTLPIFKNLNNFQIWNNRDGIQERLAQEISNLKKKVSRHIASITDLDTIVGIKHSDFFIEKEKIQIDFGNVFIDSMAYLFTCFRVTNNIPFIYFNDIFRIKKKFVPDFRWFDQIAKFPSKNFIFMKINNEKNCIKDVKDVYKKFNDTYLRLENGRLIVTAFMQVNKRNGDRNAFVKKISDSFLNVNLQTTKLIVQNIKTLDSVGVVYFPSQIFDTTVWSELCMNDKLFYRLIAVDESVRLSKMKTNVYNHVLFGDETISMQMKHDNFPIDLGINESYIRVRITHNTTLSRRLNLIEILSKLIVLHHQKAKQVQERYRKFLSSSQLDFQVPKKQPNVQKEPKDSLRYLVPKIFYPSYSRTCTNLPTIVSDDEVARLKPLQEVMKFPVYNESDEPPRNYICEHDVQIFPGLMRNKLANKNTFPYVPCCYVKNQKNVQGSLYDVYFNQTDHRPKNKIVQDFFISGKILQKGHFGNLPSTIHSLLNLAITPNQIFVRQGIRQSKLSFLEAVMTGLGLNSSENEINQMYEKMCTEKFAMATKQENSNLSIEEILTKMKNQDFEAASFVNMLEHFFQISIFIFSNEKNGILRIPDHVQSYFKWKPREKVVLIFQHVNDTECSVSHCELIVQTHLRSFKQVISTFFSNTSQVVRLIFNVFEKMTEKFKFSLPIEPQEFVMNMNIVGQYLDIFGKCRQICVEHHSELAWLVVEPIAPFIAPPMSPFRSDMKIVKQIVKVFNLQIVCQYCSKNGNIREIDVIIGNVQGTFLVDDIIENGFDKVEIKTGDERYNVLTDQITDNLSNFKNLKRISRIFLENALFVASIFFQDRPMNRETLRAFASSNIVMQKNKEWNYPTNDLFISAQNDMLIINSNNKKDIALVVSDSQIIIRLLFFISLFATRHPSLFASYKDLKFIPNFFQDPEDFDDNQGNTIIKGVENVKSLLLQTTNSDMYVYSSVKPESYKPYIFKNKLLGENVFLAQNAPSYLYANFIVFSWRTKQINPGLGQNFDATQNVYSFLLKQIDDIFSDDDEDSNILDADDFEKEENDEEEDDTVVEKKKELPKSFIHVLKDVDHDKMVENVPLVPFSVYMFENEYTISLIRNAAPFEEIVLAYKINDTPLYTVLLSSQ